MGTKVEVNTYIPGYFDMADSSVSSNGNVLPSHEDSKPNVHLSDKFAMIFEYGSVHYDKEMLKRTMLVHEATFRKQVYELHRLYKIQKDLMAQFQREELNGYPRYASQPPPGDGKGVWQTGNPISGHDIKQSSIQFVNESSSQYSVSGAPLRHNNVTSRKKMLDLQLPADVYANDDMEILDEKPKNSPGVNGSVPDGVKLNLAICEGSSNVEKSRITDIQPHHNSSGRILTKPVEELSDMKVTDFLGVGISTSQNQRYMSRGVNLNLLSLEGNLKEKYVGEVSGSRFFGSNEEIRHNNLFRQKNDVPNTSIAWLKYKQNCSDSSMGYYLSSASAFNHLILAPPGFNHALNSPWQSNNANYYGTVETSVAKNALYDGRFMDSTPNTPYHHSPKIRGETKHQKVPPFHGQQKDINLNDVPPDNTATWEQRSENSVADISWLGKKPVNLTKSQVPLSCANGYSQTLVSSTSRILCAPISAAAEKDSRCPPSVQCDINNAPLVKREADMEVQPQSKNAYTSIRNLIDLNEALPIMDDPEMDVLKSEGDIIPHEPEIGVRESEGAIIPHEANDPLRDSLVITAAESLVAMCNDVVQPGSPQLDILHWFTDLAISKGSTVLNNDSDDDFEALTLKLQETKSYKYHATPRTQEGKNNDERRSAASMLITRSQRGKARGRPRKKDFLKDVLPGLASLPKHEVSEDLRTLGRSKPVTPKKRGGRNGHQPRGRRRARSVAVIVEEADISPTPPLVPADLDADAQGITRWGRTTRRCRRPRCPPANNASLRVA